MHCGAFGPGLMKSFVVKVSPVGTPNFDDSSINENWHCKSNYDMEFVLKKIDTSQSFKRGSPMT